VFTHPEDPFLQHSLHQVLPRRHGNIPCRPLRRVGHQLFQDHQLHRVIHLLDLIQSLNVVHHLDLELVGPLRLLLP
jgi:hypothetical protein